MTQLIGQVLIPQSSTTGAACYEVEIVGDYIYAGTGNTLQVFYAPVDSLPTYAQVWERRFGSVIDDLVLVGDVLYMAANHDGVWKIDVSSPEEPETIWNWNTLAYDDAAYDISVSGDSLFVANKRKMSLIRDMGETFDFVSNFAEQEDAFSRLRGSDVYGNQIAFTVATILPSLDSSTEGVYFHALDDLTQQAFYHQPFGDHEDVIFSDDGEELYVLGGTESTSSLNINGLFYALDVADLDDLNLLYADTLEATPIFAIGSAMNAIVENDTIYVATQSAEDSIPFPWNAVNGNIYVYDAVDPQDIHTIAHIDAGLWHFDLAKRNNTLHVASEWFGIRSIDVSDLPNDTTIGDTPTGGWNVGSDVHGNRMAVGNEGYGIKLFDITTPQQPELINEHINIQNGFCMHVDFSEDGEYLFGSYFLANDGFRVFDATTLEQVAEVAEFVGYERTAVWGEHFISLHNNVVRHIDIGDPLAPEMTVLDQLSGQDFVISDNGVACFSKPGELIFYDLQTQTLETMMAVLGEQFGAVASQSDTLYVYSSTQGLLRIDVADGENPILIDATSTNLEGPKFMAANADGLYLGYQEQGVFALNLQDFISTAYYRSSLEFYLPELWGMQDLRAYEGLVLLAEYFGQTTLLSTQDVIIGTEDIMTPDISVFPNPVGEVLNINIPFTCAANIVDVNGRIVLPLLLQKGMNSIPLDQVSPGAYILLFLEHGESKVFLKR